MAANPPNERIAARTSIFPSGDVSQELTTAVVLSNFLIKKKALI
jgi:hypothetical protein